MLRPTAEPGAKRSGATGSALNVTNKQNRCARPFECYSTWNPVAPLRFAPGSALRWQRLNMNRSSIKGGGAAERVDCEVVCYIVDAGAWVFLRHVHLVPGAIMSPTVRYADDASHHLVRNLEWQNYRTYPRTHTHVVAFCELAMSRIVRVHENCALRFAPD